MSGWMPIRRSSLTECWVGLVFSSPAWLMNGHERQVDEHAAAAPDVDGELADRLEERQRLDVADGAADLGDHNVDVGGLGDQRDPLLDLVGDVRHDLHGRAEVVAAALAPDDGVVDAAGGDVGGARRVGVGEALVVAEVEVGLGAVLGHEDLAVLVGRHRAGVDVDVRIELLQRDAQPARDQQLADRGSRDALAKRGDDAAGDEDEPGSVLTISRLLHQGLPTPSLAGRPGRVARGGRTLDAKRGRARHGRNRHPPGRAGSRWRRGRQGRTVAGDAVGTRPRREGAPARTPQARAGAAAPSRRCR